MHQVLETEDESVYQFVCVCVLVLRRMTRDYGAEGIQFSPKRERERCVELVRKGSVLWEGHHETEVRSGVLGA